jgi:hypothetical protein
MVDGAGMRVMLSVSGWGPVWGSEFPVKDNPRFKPDPKKFAAFAAAVANRYGGIVDRYLVWNEPNTTLWLQPQSQCVRRKCSPYAPHHYRRILRAADPAIRRADSGAKILAGRSRRAAAPALRPTARCGRCSSCAIWAA